MTAPDPVPALAQDGQRLNPEARRIAWDVLYDFTQALAGRGGFGPDDVVRAHDRILAALTALQTENANLRKERDEAYEYLSRLFIHAAPQCEPLPELVGLATQIDNYIAGLRQERDAAHAHACENSLEERDLRAQVQAQAQTITRLREALDTIASPGATKDYGWWTETARAALSPGGETPERPVR